MTSSDFPLCIDLDGTLTPTDTLHESLLLLAKEKPATLLALPSWLRQGKAAFKRRLADEVTLDCSVLPYREDLLAWLQAQRDGGRKLILVTAADRSIAEAVASHLQLFDEVIASEGGENLSGERKRRALVARFGERGYDYAGNDTVDVAVWRSAREAIVIGDTALQNAAAQVAAVGPTFPPQRASLKLWLKAARLHQWVKNALIFVPALLAHTIAQPAVLLDAILAFIAFGFCASSVYLINDLLDLPAVCRHPTQRKSRHCWHHAAAVGIYRAGGFHQYLFLRCASRVLRRHLGLFTAPEASTVDRRDDAGEPLYRADHRRRCRGKGHALVLVIGVLDLPVPESGHCETLRGA